MSILRRLLDFLLPTPCSYCHSPVGNSPVPFFCSACWSDFSLLNGPVCPCCGRLFDSPEALSHSPGHLCGACRRELPTFDQALSVGYFEGALREAVHVLHLSLDNLGRVRPTRPQVELSGEERVVNVAGAFALRRPGEIAGKSILLVDDVFTTGATLNECARVLKDAGASRVMALTLARAV